MPKKKHHKRCLIEKIFSEDCIKAKSKALKDIIDEIGVINLLSFDEEVVYESSYSI